MNALVPYRRSDIRRGKASVVEFAAGGVAADVRVDRVDSRNRSSWYAIRLAAAATGVTSRLIGVRRSGEVDELGTVEVASGSMSSARFAVTTPRSGAYRAMYLEVFSDQLLLRVEAPRPPAGGGLRPLKFGALLVGIGVAASLVSAVPISLNHPANRAVAAPVAVPLAVAPKAIVLNAPARILSFAARRDNAPGGGETVLASYLAVGERGTIALLDASGTIISSAAFSRVGTVRLPVPPAYRALPMTARITVHKGDSKAFSSVALAPNAVPTPAPSPSPDVAGNDVGVPGEAVTPVDSSATAGSGGIVAVEGNAIAGHSLRLRFEPQPSAMHVELQDETGVTLAESEIAPRTTHAALPLPVATVRTTYLLALHYTRDGGEETVIRTVLAVPSHQL